jgi:hypothetical protein
MNHLALTADFMHGVDYAAFVAFGNFHLQKAYPSLSCQVATKHGGAAWQQNKNDINSTHSALAAARLRDHQQYCPERKGTQACDAAERLPINSTALVHYYVMGALSDTGKLALDQRL